MSFRVERTEYDPQSGFLYYVSFKPTLELEKDEIHSRIPVETALSLSELGDIADLSFVLPKTCRSEHALTFVNRPGESQYVEPRIFIAMPEHSGDAVITAPAKLDLDIAGRIVGMEIHWAPSEKMAVTDEEQLAELQREAADVIEREEQPNTEITPAVTRRNCES